MVLAIAENRDIAHYNCVVRLGKAFVVEGFAEHLGDFVVGIRDSLEHFLEHFSYS